MADIRSLRRLAAAAWAILCFAFAPGLELAVAAENGQNKTIGGLTVYIGFVPAELVKGPTPPSAERSMHGRVPKGVHESHMVAAIFDSTTGARISETPIVVEFKYDHRRQ